MPDNVCGFFVGAIHQSRILHVVEAWKRCNVEEAWGFRDDCYWCIIHVPQGERMARILAFFFGRIWEEKNNDELYLAVPSLFSFSDWVAGNLERETEKLH